MRDLKSRNKKELDSFEETKDQERIVFENLNERRRLLFWNTKMKSFRLPSSKLVRRLGWNLQEMEEAQIRISNEASESLDSNRRVIVRN